MYILILKRFVPRCFVLCKYLIFLVIVFFCSCHHSDQVQRNNLELDCRIVRCQQNESLPLYSDYIIEVCNATERKLHLPLSFRGLLLSERTTFVKCLSKDSILQISHPAIDRWQKLEVEECIEFVITHESFSTGKFNITDSSGIYLSFDIESECSDCDILYTLK